jgi:hypothetical protein
MAAPSVLERVARARDKRAAAETAFRAALAEAHEFHSWAQIAAVAGVTPSAVRYLVNEHAKKGENGDG